LGLTLLHPPHAIGELKKLDSLKKMSLGAALPEKMAKKLSLAWNLCFLNISAWL
jgi:hypothetical protein